MYKRVLLKISGEALSRSGDGRSISPAALTFISDEIRKAWRPEIQLAVVVGGGNIWRGARDGHGMIDRVTSDNMGMLATIINAMALQSALEHKGIHTRVQTAIEISRLAEPFIRRRAIRHLEKGRVVIFAGGTGNPYFTTDSAAALRAAEIGADVIFKATQVDGVYTGDPKLNKNARMIKKITYMEAIRKGLKFMDTSALTLCMENHLPILVFNLHVPNNIKKAVGGEIVGTLIK
ncbi:MAG: UMP kinase [Elusimicrobia bacterium GWA2_56_46]|nr:MAG: UMP kinase [Elusimicrobia bacterium GWA2_56_46]OGR55265.1 MAG: UMP kinase [Elusimicrobia bacterium GWC2_56_31]HBB66927.1 UMP kinase [Elusimicrobiota bacterium]HBW22774.1 UMP kinase [Elusimicrobiota bacterium]